MKYAMQQSTGSRNPRKSEQPDVEVGWSDYPRIEPGTYTAYSRSARWYLDPNFKRWVCLLTFDVLSANLLHTFARVPMFLNGGAGAQPKAGRRSRYWAEWVHAAGKPSRANRLSPQAFTRRVARVEVRDTEGSAPYSVVCQILSWETGSLLGQSVNKSHSQGRHEG